MIALDPRERALAEEVARATASAVDLEAATAPWKPYAYPPRDEVALPVVHLDDVSAIPFLDGITGVEFYQLRARVRARTGDLVAAACDEVPGYETYNRERLRIGEPSFVFARPLGHPARVAFACRHGEAFEALRTAAQRAGGLVLHPYMGSEAVWELARELGRATGTEIRVLAPPPPVTWLANDKAHLGRAAESLVADGILGGRGPIVETRHAHGPEALAAHLRELARSHRRVALKMTRCASAMGNQVFEAREVLAAEPADLVAIAADFLVRKRWTEGDEVLAVAWEDATSSPSTQLWIPPRGAGDPRVEGVYEQLLRGAEQLFVGALPSRLGPDVDRSLARASLRIATMYQALGYVGRCSFDFIVTGRGAFFVECNGRWGGTSTPMHLMDRLFPGGRPPYRARDFVHPDLARLPFPELVRVLGDELYDARTGRGRFVLYNAGCLAPAGKIDVISIGRDLDDATRGLEEDLPRLLGL